VPEEQPDPEAEVRAVMGDDWLDADAMRELRPRADGLGRVGLVGQDNLGLGVGAAGHAAERRRPARLGHGHCGPRAAQTRLPHVTITSPTTSRTAPTRRRGR
jgi:hypothetical protein